MFYISKDFGNGFYGVTDSKDGVEEKVSLQQLRAIPFPIYGYWGRRVTVYKSLQNIVDRYNLLQRVSGFVSFKVEYFPPTEHLSSTFFRGELIALTQFNPRGEEKVVVPEFVMAIKGRGFEGCENIKTIVLPRHLESIGTRCFDSCVSLTEITLPPSLSELSSGAFLECRSLRRIVIPEGITKIPLECFSNCNNLEYVILPKSLREISDYAFNACVSLEEIVIPDGVTAIGADVFSECPNLRIVNIPINAEVVALAGLLECSSLKSIYISKKAKMYDAFMQSRLKSLVKAY